jgi:hypothetical protein
MSGISKFGVSSDNNNFVGIIGPRGLAGKDGKDGIDGKDGLDGKDAYECKQ